MEEELLEEDKEHEIFCGCNGGWNNTDAEHPDSLCILDNAGVCQHTGVRNGIPQHTEKVIMYLFPDYDPLIERRRRSIPEDSVVPVDRSLVHKRVCPKCRKMYHIVVHFEHGDCLVNQGRRLRTSNIVDPEVAAEEIATGKRKPRNTDEDRPTLRPDVRWR